ncbi:dihydrodipicolinate synthase family protein [Rhizobium rhizoryzae]|uniref:4-hydroxy-tetrahydrodipicolinate synthase n=1 Tax=Rhizobium rhizoryzae TaxID=451876 RepID=A0A7W6PPJ8_9HYPH|nr:dihydrodipicolinate synthase family protein [Rhizobium rhizoryzae]MBB4142573.1 4-hydroxy-tetrahydrodipicolinate synthase [Rhizobium rhizoryzae]
MFEGLSAFPTTPTNADGEVDAVALARVLDRLAEAKVGSIGLLGSTGAYAYLSREERRRAVEAAKESIGERVPLLVGVGALRTDHAQQLARDAEAAGADALLLAPVSYAPLTQEEVYQHFVSVSNATGLPIVIYNNPTTTRFQFSLDLIQKLAIIPNIAAIKMPLPGETAFADEIRSLRALAPSGFSIGYSGDWGAADGLLAGAEAWYSVVAGLLPQPALALTQAAIAGDRAEAERLNAMFEPLWSLFKEFGSFRVMYAIGSLLGLFEAEPPRPVLPVPASARPRIEAALDELR